MSMDERARTDARNRVHAHLAMRMAERRIPFDYCEVPRLEARIAAMAPCYLVPDRVRYAFSIKHETGRLIWVWDNELSAMVTVFRRRRPFLQAHEVTL